MSSVSRITKPGVFTSDECSTTFAIPVSYQQLTEAGVELNSHFDDDAGEGLGLGEILLTRTTAVNGKKLVAYYGCVCLQTTLSRPQPHWADAGMVFDRHAAGHKNRLEAAKNQTAMEELWERLVTPSLREAIAKDEMEWESLIDQIG